MEIGPQPYRDLNLSAARQKRMGGILWDDVDCSRPEAVDGARNAITRMDLWDSVVDWVVGGGEKRKALNAIADMVLCDVAAAWQKRFPGQVLDERLSKLDRVDAQLRLMDLLSPEGRRVVLANPVETRDGIRFHPTTGTVLDSLLAVTLPLAQGKALLEDVTRYTENNQVSVPRRFSDVSEAWQNHRANLVTAEALMNDAQVHRGKGDLYLAANAHLMAAGAFAAAGHHEAAANSWANAVLDKDGIGQAREAAGWVGELAQQWEKCGRHDLAAQKWGNQAERYQVLKLHERAAEARGNQARCAELAHLHDVARTSWLAQADIYRSLDLDDHAQESAEKAKEQAKLHAASERILPRDMLLGELAKHLKPDDVMALASVSHRYRATIVSSEDSVKRVVADLNSLTPDKYQAQLDEGLPILQGLDPGSRLEPLQKLVANLHILADADRGPAFAKLVSAAAGLPQADQVKLFGTLSQSIDALPNDDKVPAWGECFRAIKAAVDTGATRVSVAWISLSQSLGTVAIPLQRARFFLKILSEVGSLDPADPDKATVLLELASQAPKLIHKDYKPYVIIEMFKIADAVGHDYSCRGRLGGVLYDYADFIPNSTRT